MDRQDSVAGRVFSACAEVVPPKGKTMPTPISILRVRGGSSSAFLRAIAAWVYSPRARR